MKNNDVPPSLNLNDDEDESRFYGLDSRESLLKPWRLDFLQQVLALREDVEEFLNNKNKVPALPTTKSIPQDMVQRLATVSTQQKHMNMILYCIGFFGLIFIVLLISALIDSGQKVDRCSDWTIDSMSLLETVAKYPCESSSTIVMMHLVDGAVTFPSLVTVGDLFIINCTNITLHFPNTKAITLLSIEGCALISFYANSVKVSNILRFSDTPLLSVELNSLENVTSHISLRRASLQNDEMKQNNINGIYQPLPLTNGSYNDSSQHTDSVDIREGYHLSFNITFLPDATWVLPSLRVGPSLFLIDESNISSLSLPMMNFVGTFSVLNIPSNLTLLAPSLVIAQEVTLETCTMVKYVDLNSLVRVYSDINILENWFDWNRGNTFEQCNVSSTTLLNMANLVDVGRSLNVKWNIGMSILNLKNLIQSDVTNVQNNVGLCIINLPSLLVSTKISVLFHDSLEEINLLKLHYVESLTFISNSYSRELNFPSLEGWGEVVISLNPRLEDVNFPMFRLGGVSISNNNALKTVQFPVLEVAKAFIMINNPLIDDINLPYFFFINTTLNVSSALFREDSTINAPVSPYMQWSLTLYQGSYTIIGNLQSPILIANNNALRTFSAPYFETTFDSIILDSNPNFEKLNLSSLENARRRFVVIENPQLKSVDLPLLSSVHRLHLMNNANLTFANFPNVSAVRNVTIKNNEKLCFSQENLGLAFPCANIIVINNSDCTTCAANTCYSCVEEVNATAA